MGVFLLILQIIGIVLGVIAAFIVFAIVTPLTYRAEGSFHKNKPDGNLRAGWLLNLIRVFAEYKKGKPKVQVKVLFFTVFDSTKKSKRRRKRSKKKRKAIQAQAKPVKEKEELFTIEDEPETDTFETPEEDKGILGKIRSIFAKIKGWLDMAKEKAGAVLVWLDPEHRRLIGFLWENGLKLFQKVKPKHFYLKGKGGTGDPYYTGMILCWTGIATGMLGIPGVEIEPDYEKKTLDLDAEASGHFFVLPVALIALKIYRNKDFKRFILKKNIPVEE